MQICVSWALLLVIVCGALFGLTKRFLMLQQSLPDPPAPHKSCRERTLVAPKPAQNRGIYLCGLWVTKSKVCDVCLTNMNNYQLYVASQKETYFSAHVNHQALEVDNCVTLSAPKPICQDSSPNALQIPCKRQGSAPKRRTYHITCALRGPVSDFFGSE